MPPEYNVEVGFLQMFEQSGNVEQELIKPKNMFTYTPVTGTGNTTISVMAGTANGGKSYAFEEFGLLDNHTS